MQRSVSMKKLKREMMRIPWASPHHVVKVSDKDSEEWSEMQYDTPSEVTGKTPRQEGKYQLQEFREKLKSGELDDFRFKGIRIIWYAGPETQAVAIVDYEAEKAAEVEIVKKKEWKSTSQKLYGAFERMRDKFTGEK